MTRKEVNSILQDNFGFGIFPVKKSSKTLGSKKRYVEGTPHSIEISGQTKLYQMSFEFDTHMGIEGITLPNVPLSCQLDEVKRYLNPEDVYGTSEFFFHDISLDEELLDLGLHGLTVWNIPINSQISKEMSDHDILNTYNNCSGVRYLSVSPNSLLHRRMKRKSRIIPKLYTIEGETISGLTHEVCVHKHTNRKKRITIWMEDDPDFGEPMSVKLPIGISPTDVKYHFVWVKYCGSCILLDIEVTSKDGHTKYQMNSSTTSMEYSDDMLISVVDDRHNMLTGCYWGYGMIDEVKRVM